jgi:RHS repeat-associated protein
VLLRYQDKSLLVSFAEAWLCDPNCPAALLAWDTTDDDYIDYYDYVDNTVYFEGAFSNNIYYCLTDKDNSVVGVVDADGDIEYIAYNAWGTPNYTGDIQGLSVLWNGYYFDSETENYYLRNRYYSPQERRFLTDDPHGIVPDGNWNNPWNITTQYVDGVGLTVYAGFNPITRRDDWGLWGWGRDKPKCEYDSFAIMGYQYVPCKSSLKDVLLVKSLAEIGIPFSTNLIDFAWTIGTSPLYPGLVDSTLNYVSNNCGSKLYITICYWNCYDGEPELDICRVEKCHGDCMNFSPRMSRTREKCIANFRNNSYDMGYKGHVFSDDDMSLF